LLQFSWDEISEMLYRGVVWIVGVKSLLYDFLEQLVVLLNEGFLLHHVSMIKIEKETSLKATVVGDMIDEKYDVNSEVKAITYHDMEVKKLKGKYMIQVIVDI
jgi:SHS2 domain-containing protein